MSEQTKPIGEDDLTAYLDDALAPERRALVELWLDRHPEIRARPDKDRQIADQLRAAFDPVVDAPVPERLRVRAIRNRRRRHMMLGLRQIAAAVVLVAIGMGAGWLARGPGDPGGIDREIEAALSAHRIFVVEKRHPVEVSAEARDHLWTWLGNRIGNRIEIPDLSSFGLSLVGGRLLPGPRGPAGQLMYETAAGDRVTLYVQTGTGTANRFLFAELDGVPALAWRSPELSYVLAGPLPRSNLTAIAHAVHTMR